MPTSGVGVEGAASRAPLIVLDTTVIVAAVRGHPEASSARVIREVATGGLRLALSDAFLSEVTRFMKDPEVDRGIGSAGRAFEIALDIGVMGVLYRLHRYDWPSLRDPND